VARAEALEFIQPMEARLVSHLPDEAGWQFEPKWDGFRCIAAKHGDAVELWGKSGKPLGGYFPEIVSLMAGLPMAQVMLDGELIVSIDGAGSFDALQQRLHPAESRVRKLSAETPAMLVVFDLLGDGKTRLLDQSLAVRRAALEGLVARLPKASSLRLSPAIADREAASRWLSELRRELDGVIAKRLDAPYLPGERAMLKVKRIRTADCVVGGFRYGTDSDQVGSLLLGLYDADGRLHHVGFTSAFARDEKPALTKKLEGLRGGAGFTGRAPGGPSRWSTERSRAWVGLRSELVVEVQYDQVTGQRFRHGVRFVRWRPDKAPASCTFDQLAAPKDPDAVIQAVLSAGATRVLGNQA
jgi:ATP-dependent DNA ligase